MSLALANEGKADVLEAKRSFYNSQKVVLFCSSLSIDGSTTIGNITSNLPPVTPTVSPGDSPNFGAAYLNGSNKAQMDGTAPITFLFNGSFSPFDIYGYAVVNTGETKLYFAELRSSPVTISADGDSFSVTLHYTEDTAP